MELMTTVSEFIAAMEKMHISQKVTIPLAVMFRLFPTIVEESNSISKAMAMRRTFIWTWTSFKGNPNLQWKNLQTSSAKQKKTKKKPATFSPRSTLNNLPNVTHNLFLADKNNVLQLPVPLQVVATSCYLMNQQADWTILTCFKSKKSACENIIRYKNNYSSRL